MKRLTKDWVRQFGSTQDDQSTSLTTDSRGNIYISGFTNGHIDDLEPGAFVAKYNPFGSKTWMSNVSSGATNQATSITKIDGLIHIIGLQDNTSGASPKDQVFFRRFFEGSQPYNLSSVTIFGTADDDFPVQVLSHKIGYTPLVYIAGNTKGVLTDDSTYVKRNEVEGFLAVYDYFGELRWVKQINSSLAEGAEMPGDSIDIRCIAKGDNNSIYAIAEIVHADSFDYLDYLLLKFDQEGNIIWKKVLGSSGVINTMASDVAGNFYCNLHTNGDENYIPLGISKFDKDGNFLWHTDAGTPDSGYGEIKDIAINKEENLIYVVGSVNSSLSFELDTHKGGDDFFLAEFSVDGKLQYVEQFGTVANEKAEGITIDDFGNIYVTGTTNSDMESGGHKGGKDVFLTRWSYTRDFDLVAHFKSMQKQNLSILATMKKMQEQMRLMSIKIAQSEAELNSLSLQLDADVMLEAKKKISKVGDYRISGSEAEDLIEFAKKGNSDLGKLEQKTLAHIYASHNLTAPAKRAISAALKN